MLSKSRIKIILIVLVVLVAVSVVAYRGYVAYRRNVLHNAVAALVRDGGQRLQEALLIETGIAPSDNAETVRKLEESAAAVDAQLTALRALNARPDGLLVDAADDYLLSARQILRNQAAGHRYRIQVLAATQALRNHMRSAGHRSPAWIDEALRAKGRVEKDFLDYSTAIEAFGNLLKSFPDARAVLTPRLGVPPPPEDSLAREARGRALETLKQTSDDTDKLKQLAVAR